jgi:hypothetical protein
VPTTLLPWLRPQAAEAEGSSGAADPDLPPSVRKAGPPQPPADISSLHEAAKCVGCRVLTCGAGGGGPRAAADPTCRPRGAPTIRVAARLPRNSDSQGRRQPSQAAHRPPPTVAVGRPCRWGDAEATKRLVESGADVNAKNERGVTALGVAVGFNRHGVVQALLDCGADVMLTDGAGNTPLHYAAGYGRKEIMEQLLGAGGGPPGGARLGVGAAFCVCVWGGGGGGICGATGVQPLRRPGSLVKVLVHGVCLCCVGRVPRGMLALE